MNLVRQLIHEAHRRSLWQVLGIFLAASWAVLQAVELLTQAAGLPDWTPSMALVLLLIGLPICLGTAFVQEGGPGSSDARPAGAAGDPEPPSPTRDHPAPNLARGTGSLDLPSSRPSRMRRLLTWRHAAVGGLGAFAILALSLIGYRVMWQTGFGPVGNLVAQGVIAPGERVVLADFEDATGEGVGAAVTQALRVDLAGASVLDLVDPADIRPTLERMQLPPGAVVNAEVAREVALRDGIPAVIDGAVSRVGTGYLITASLREAQSGRAVASFRVTAEDPARIIESIDKLSQDLRERSGESLREIRAGEPLQQVTTSSLEALVLYSEADRYFAFDYDRSIEALERVVEIDPEFAMAWRLLAVAYNNTVSDPERQEVAIREAFDHRDRLTELERLLAEASYYDWVENDRARAARAYEEILRTHPDNAVALNNLAGLRASAGRLEEAIELFHRAGRAPGGTPIAYSNTVLYELVLGRVERAAQALAEWEERFPDTEAYEQARFAVALLAEAPDRAEAIARARYEDSSLGPIDRSDGALMLAAVALWRGRLDEMRTWIGEAEELAASASAPAVILPRMVSAVMELAAGNRGRARRGLAELASDPGHRAFMRAAGFEGYVGMLGGAAGDTSFVAELEQGLVDAPPGPRTELSRQQLGAGLALARAVEGRPEGTMEVIDAWRRAEGCETELCMRTPYAIALEAVGEVGPAVELYEAMVNGGNEQWPFTGTDAVLGRVRAGPLYEQLGDTARAIAAYERLLRMWESPQAEAAELASSARARLDALQRR